MPIKFECPSCGKAYNVKDELAGKKAKCGCGAVMPIPNPAASAPIQNDPLFGADPLGDDLFGSAATSGSSTPHGNSLFDEEFPTGGAIPAAATSYHMAPRSMTPVQPAAGYAVSVPAVGPSPPSVLLKVGNQKRLRREVEARS